MIFVLLPIFLRYLYIPLLTGFVAAAQQNDDAISFFAKIDPIARSKKYPKL
jgi:hypothetical protein